MSVISDRHSVVLFKAGDKPQEGQRLLKIGYKSTKKNAAKYTPACVSVPFIQPESVIENLQALLPHIGDMLEKAQDDIGRNLYERNKGKLPMSISDEDISVPACVKFLDAKRNGEKLTATALGNWFDSDVAEPFANMLAVKLGTEDTQDARILGQCKIYRAKFSALTETQVLTRDDILRLQRVAALAEESIIADKVTVLLDDLLEASSNAPEMMGLD